MILVIILILGNWLKYGGWRRWVMVAPESFTMHALVKFLTPWFLLLNKILVLATTHLVDGSQSFCPKLTNIIQLM